MCVRLFNQETPKIRIQRSFQRARAVCGLGHIHFHDLRHSAASELINAGVDLFTVGRVLGHKDPRSTQRYSHLAIDTLTAAAGKIGKKSDGQYFPHYKRKKPPVRVALISCPCFETRMDITCTGGEGGIQHIVHRVQRR